MAAEYNALKGMFTNSPSVEDYTHFPSPKLSDLPSDLQDVNLDGSNPSTPIEMKISSPPKAPKSSPKDTESKNKSPTRKFKKRRKSRAPYINMRLKNISKLFDREQIYFGCIAPLRSDHIDLHCNELSDLDLHYCCGLYMKIDRSFTIHTILSTEFITSLKKIILKKEQSINQFVDDKASKHKEVELKVDDDSKSNANDNINPVSNRQYIAFHPRDHWEFAKDMEHKNAVIFIHGQNYAPDEQNAAEFVMNECLAFYADMPYLVIPFIWPCEGMFVILYIHCIQFLRNMI